MHMLFSFYGAYAYPLDHPIKIEQLHCICAKYKKVHPSTTKMTDRYMGTPDAVLTLFPRVKDRFARLWHLDSIHSYLSSTTFITLDFTEMHTKAFVLINVHRACKSNALVLSLGCKGMYMAAYLWLIRGDKPKQCSPVHVYVGMCVFSGLADTQGGTSVAAFLEALKNLFSVQGEGVCIPGLCCTVGGSQVNSRLFAAGRRAAIGATPWNKVALSGSEVSMFACKICLHDSPPGGRHGFGCKQRLQRSQFRLGYFILAGVI